MTASPIRSTELLEIAWGTLCPLVFFLMVSYLAGLFVFGPLHARAVWTPPNTRFRIVDILILLVHLQLVGGLVFALAPLIPGSEVTRYAAALVSWVLIGFWWWTGVRMLAKARVDHAPHRLFFLAVVLPIGYVATFGIVMAPLTLVFSFAMLYWMLANGNPEELLKLLGLVLANIGVIAAVIGVRWYCSQIVERARDDIAREDGIDFGPLAVRSIKGLIRHHQPMASERDVRIVEEP